MDMLISNAPIIGLLIFFSFFSGVLMWMLRPGMKKKLQAYAHIPLKEEPHDRP